MSEINERISELILKLNIKKKDFSDRLNVSPAFVSQLCSGASQPSDRTISDICSEFNVNREWLIYGTGPIFADLSRQKKIAAFIGDLMADDKDDDFKLSFIEAISQMTPEEWALVERMARRITGGK